MLVRPPHMSCPNRGLPQVPYINKGPSPLIGVPRVGIAVAPQGQEVPALCRLEQVEVVHRAVAVDAALQ
jgi:hypothetical protein